MQASLLSLFQGFDKLYFNQIDLKSIKSISEISALAWNFFFFSIFLSIFHSIIIYVFANLSNQYRYYRMILISTLYAILASFCIGKIVETLFALFLQNIPFAGSEIMIFNRYGALTIAYIFEVFLVINRLKVLFERGKLASEPIGSDIFLGVTIATLSTIMLFVFF